MAPHETERRGMSNSPPLNPFMSVRPRGKDAPSKTPRKTNHSKAPMEGDVHLLLDSNGRQTVSLAPRTSGITIESREQWLANEAKLARLVGGCADELASQGLKVNPATESAGKKKPAGRRAVLFKQSTRKL